jgi:hypothetical protein
MLYHILNKGFFLIFFILRIDFTLDLILINFSKKL